MKFKFGFLVTVIILALNGCASEQLKPKQAKATTNSALNDDIVCKKRRSTGTRIPEKRCMSRAAWERIAEASQNARNKLNKPAYNRVNED